jgi:hypothetical protein
MRKEAADQDKLTSGKVPLEKTLSSRVSMAMRGWLGSQRKGGSRATEAGTLKETHINKQVLPQAPSPTMTSFLRSSAAMVDGLCMECVGGFDVAARRAAS